LKEYDELHLQNLQLIRSKVGVIFRQFSTQTVGAQPSTTTNQKDCNPPFFYFISPLLSSVVLQGGMIIIILLLETYKKYRYRNLPSSGGS
jgi:hypothetical protein